MPSPPSNPDPHPALSLLLQSHTPSAAATIHTTRILHKPLLLRKTSPPPSSTARTTRRNARIEKSRAQEKRSKGDKVRPLTARERRAMGVDDLTNEAGRGKVEGGWEGFEGLRRLWAGYVREILGVGNGDSSGGDKDVGGENKGENKGGGESRGGGVVGGGGYITAQSAGPILAAADMHGAEIEVVKSRCVSRVGLRGTVVQDRKMVFVVVGRDGGAKKIPKEHTVFRIEVPLLGAETKPLVFEIHGEMLRNRAPERAKKSFKMHYRPDL